MIKYNNNTINDWYFYTSDIVKVYRNNAICYYKITVGGGQVPCFAVVDDITLYSETEFEDVFNKADNKWYKLNNLSQYEQYGIYGSGRTITTYDGKLTIDDGYEYMYSGGSWINVGEVSGSTATLPDVSFVLNYNAKNYDATTHSIPQTSGQTKGIDAICNYNPNNIIDNSSNGYVSVTGNTRLTISGGTTSLARSNNQTGCTMTIVSKARTDNVNESYSIITNRGSYSDMNWMWRYPANGIFLHGSSSYSTVTYYTPTSASPITASVRVSWDGSVKQQINDWTNNGSYSGAFQYGSTSNSGALFCDYLKQNAEFWKGDFYWVYMSHEVLTDEQIQQVINYNEGGGGQPIYPLEYVVREDPPDNLVFSTMAEAEAYECPWVGMKATIDGDKYIFSGDSQSGYEWVYKPSRLPQGYTEVEYIENTSTAYINTEVLLYDSTTNSYNIQCKCYFQPYGNDFEYLFGTEETSSPYVGVTFRYYQRNIQYASSPDNVLWTHVDNGDGTSGITASCSSTTATNGNNPLTLFCGLWSTGPWRNGRGKIYSFKVTKNSTLVRDLVPCKRDSDDKYGMYDIVNDVFYLSPNNVDFSGGNPV